MDENLSVQFFLRFLKEKHGQFVQSINHLLEKLVEEDKNAKKKAAQKALDSAVILKNTLSNSDVPNWLNQSIKSLEWYLRNFTSNNINNGLLTRIIPVYSEMKSYTWEFEKASKIDAFDFDSIYEECKKESKLDELFEEIINSLQKIIDSNEIDSIKIMSTLEKLIATLKKHNTASYFSIHSMYDFLIYLMKNILWEQLSDLPVAGSIIKGLRKTIDETGVELEQLQRKMKDQMKSQYDSEFNFLDYAPGKSLPKNK